MNNIPSGYDMNGERCGNGLMDNDIEEVENRFVKGRFVKVGSKKVRKAVKKKVL